MRLARGIVILTLLTMPRPAMGQSIPRPGAPEDSPRFFADVNLSGLTSSPSHERQFQGFFLRAAEVGTMHATYPAPSRVNRTPLADVSGGVMLRQRLGIGLRYSRTTYKDAAGLDATVPHPTFLNAAAVDTGTTAALKRRESAVSLFLSVLPVRTEKAQLRFFGGPAYYSYKADMVSQVLYDESADPSSPQHSIVITGGTTATAKGSGLGVQVGSDYTYFFTKLIGLSGGVRFSRAIVSIDKEPLSGLSQDVRVGGTLVFAGVQFRFGR